MANEFTCVEKPTIIVRRTVADGTAVVKNTGMKLTSPNTAAASTTDTPFAGITVEEKTASDGIVDMAMALDGVWSGISYATTTVGTAVKLSNGNLITTAIAADLLSGNWCGVAESTATNGNAIRWRARGF